MFGQLRKAMLIMLLMLNYKALAQVEEMYAFRNDVDRDRYYTLVDELRCPKCQNQNLADSNAELAQDLRDKIAELIVQDFSNDEIVSYMVERYGEFVRYEPAVNKDTLWLWFGPLVLALCGVGVLLISTRRSDSRGDEISDEISGEKGHHDQALSESEKQRLQRLMEGGDRD